MICPSCGGTERETLAPNLYRCKGSVSARIRDWEPDFNMPVGGMRPTDSFSWSSADCGFTFREGPGGAYESVSCGCGSSAINYCSCHGTPVCRMHSTTAHGVLICWTEEERRGRAATYKAK